MTSADKLRQAKALIGIPQKWCRGAYESHGRFCAAGALHWVAGDPNAFGCLDEAAREIGHRSVITLNDATNHRTVMKMFDRAIELAEQAE